MEVVILQFLITIIIISMWLQRRRTKKIIKLQTKHIVTQMIEEY